MTTPPTFSSYTQYRALKLRYEKLSLKFGYRLTVPPELVAEIACELASTDIRASLDFMADFMLDNKRRARAIALLKEALSRPGTPEVMSRLFELASQVKPGASYPGREMPQPRFDAFKMHEQVQNLAMAC